MKYVLGLLNKYSVYLILSLAAALRFRQLEVRDFWYDEAFTGIAVKESWAGMMRMIMSDVHPPLYYLGLKAFAFFFAYSVLGIRLFSAIFGLLCVVAVYLFTKELFGKKAALFASIVAAISPFALQYSQEGRMYSMFTFFVIMAAYFLVRSFRPRLENVNFFKKYKNPILFGVFLGLSALTHYMGIFFAPIFYLVYFVWNARLETDGSVSTKNIVEFIKKLLPSKDILIGYAAAIIVFLPWITSFVNHVAKTSSSNSLDWIRAANFGDIAVNIQMFIFGTPLGEMSSGMPGPNEFYGISDISVWVLVTVFITAVVIYLFRGKSKNKSENYVMGDNFAPLLTVILLSFGFMTLIWLMGFFGKYFFVARYLLAAGFFVFVLLGVWLSRIRISYAIISVTFYIVLLFLTIPLGYSEGWNVLEKNLNKYSDKDFYILNSFDYVIAKYYLGADRLTLYNVDWPPYNPDYWAAIGSTLKRTENFEDLRNDKNALIISNTQLGGQDNKNFDPSGLTLVAQYKNILIYKFQ